MQHDLASTRVTRADGRREHDMCSVHYVVLVLLCKCVQRLPYFLFNVLQGLEVGFQGDLRGCWPRLMSDWLQTLFTAGPYKTSRSGYCAVPAYTGSPGHRTDFAASRCVWDLRERKEKKVKRVRWMVPTKTIATKTHAHTETRRMTSTTQK